MPQEGENLLRFVRALAERDGWSIGPPWLSDGGRALLLPILRTETRKRPYVLAQEVAADVRAKDTGRIDRIRIRNDSGSRIVICPGTVFRGLGTNSRASTVGAAVEPNGIADLEVKCVEAGHPVAAGESLELTPTVVPEAVLQALLRRDQGRVWAAIRSSTPTDGLTADDPIGALADGTGSGRSAEELIRAVPRLDRQCGAFLIDEDGVEAMEMFDSPESWDAASNAFVQRHADALRPTRGSPLKTIANEEAAIGLAKGFLDELARAGQRRLGEYSWFVSQPLAEFTAIGDEVIHLIAFHPMATKSRAAEFVRTTSNGFADAGNTESFLEQSQSNPDADGSEAGTASVARAIALSDEAEPLPYARPARRRKVLTSGWDPRTFEALERYSHKEFEGDRSAALRFLARTGLQERGYWEAQPWHERLGFSMPSGERQGPVVADEVDQAHTELRIQELERIALTTAYAKWLRKRATLELERLASATESDLGEAARAALDRIPPLEPSVEIPERLTEPEPALSPSPVDVRGLLRQALTASAGGDYAQALTRHDEVLEIEPDNATALLGRAIALRRSGKPLEALADLDLVLHLQPSNAAALMNRGRILQERGDLTAALDTFDRLRSIAPNDWDVWKARGDLLVKMGRDEEAVAAYAEALRRNPEDEKLQRRLRALEKSPPTSRPIGPSRPATTAGVEEGQSYLVKERRPELCYRALKALAAQRVPTMIITYQAPDRVRRESGLTEVKILGLSHSTGREVLSPTALPVLAKVIERFVDANQGRGAILLDGLEYLIANNGFREAILFVEHVNEFILQRKAIVLIPLAPDAISDKEFALLERNLRLLS